MYQKTKKGAFFFWPLQKFVSYLLDFVVDPALASPVHSDTSSISFLEQCLALISFPQFISKPPAFLMFVVAAVKERTFRL